VKILHVVPTYYPATRYGGPITSVRGLCRALVNCGHSVDVATTGIDGNDQLYTDKVKIKKVDGVTVRYFKSSMLRRLYWSHPMKRYLSGTIRDYDVVHIHSVFLWPTWAAARQARLQKKPYILAPRGMLVPDLIRRKSFIKKTVAIELFDRKAIELADMVHFTSEQERRDCEAARLETRSHCILPNGIDTSQIPGEIDKTQPDDKFILYLGRINWKKGIDRLIRTMNYLPESKLVIAGNDEENYRRSLNVLAQEVGVSDQIKYVGPVHCEDKWRLLSKATVVVLPSRSENFGNVVLEAMAVGTPVVVTGEVGISDEVVASSAGLVSDGSPMDLAEKINRIFDNPDYATQMGSNGRSVVRQKYEWSVIAKRMESIYSQLCETENR